MDTFLERIASDPQDRHCYGQRQRRHRSESEELLPHNDPKLSDGGGWRDGCAGAGGGAASVTAGAVRCSAWLGDMVLLCKALDHISKSLEKLFGCSSRVKKMHVKMRIQLL